MKHDEIVIRGRTQLRALSSPLRVRILDALMHRSPCSVGEIAQALGRPPPTLYHHLKIMLRARVVLPAGERGTGREREQLFKPAARRIRSAVTGVSKRDLQELARVGEAHTRHVLRRYSNALKTGDATLAGPARNSVVRHLTLTLPPERLKALNADLDAFVRKWTAGAPSRNGEEISLLILMGHADKDRKKRSR
jgi:DNA-binding transcriptional ArsR family regulator